MSMFPPCPVSGLVSWWCCSPVWRELSGCLTLGRTAGQGSQVPSSSCLVWGDRLFYWYEIKNYLRKKNTYKITIMCNKSDPRGKLMDNNL